MRTWFVLVLALAALQIPAQRSAIAVCSAPGTTPATLTFLNATASRTVRVHWYDFNCSEVFYRALAPGESYSQSTFVGHVWRVRDTAGTLLQEAVATAQPLTVRISDVQVLLPVVVGGGGAVTPPIGQRALADRPDDVAGYQVHVMYVLPSDGQDRALDTNGTLARSVAAFQGWFRGQTNGRSIRLDTYGGQVDITFVRLSQSDQTIKDTGALVRDAIERELKERRLINPRKLYAVYYDGGSTVSCGGGAWPPNLVGNVGALYLRGTPPGARACDTNEFAASIERPGYLEFAMIHEIVHTLGFTPACAPHSGGGAHVGDDPHDLMYAGPQPWQPAILDVGRDDYFEHGRADCLDLARSAFLDPLPDGAQPPPGWQ